MNVLVTSRAGGLESESELSEDEAGSSWMYFLLLMLDEMGGFSMEDGSVGG